MTDPVTNTTIVSELKNTLGSMNCISKDSNKCTLDNISMVESESGDFAANFDLPKAVAADTSTIKQ